MVLLAAMGMAMTMQAADYYRVVGVSTVLGSNWSTGDANNNMTETSSGTYTLVKKGVSLTSGTNYEYKIIKNGAYSNGQWPLNGNASFSVNSTGLYDVTFTFSPSGSGSYSARATRVYTVAGDNDAVFGTTWDVTNTANDMSDNDGDGVFTLDVSNVTLTAGTYYYKVAEDHSWNNSWGLNGGLENASFTITADGTYDLTFFFNSSTHVPSVNIYKPGVYVIGNVGAQSWSDASQGKAMTETASGSGLYIINDVPLTNGAYFAFATGLSTEASNWGVTNTRRLMPSGGNNTDITTGGVGAETYNSGTAYGVAHYSKECNFHFTGTTGTYNIALDLNNMKAYVYRDYATLFMRSCAPNQTKTAQEMTTNDGVHYQLYNVTFSRTNGNAYFNFNTASDGSGTSYGADADGDNFYLNAEYINRQLSLPSGSTKNFFYNLDEGSYNVLVNVQENWVKLTAAITDETVVTVYLNTQNVEGAALTAFDKLKANVDGNTIVVNGNTYGRYTPTYIGQVSTPDGNTWWEWTVPNSIADMYFTRTNGSVTTSEILWRKAGEVWYIWPATNSETLTDVTRIYYDVAENSVPECATMLEGHYYVYYVNTLNWSHVNIYAWQDGENDNDTELTGSWPGVSCIYVGKDADGHEVWVYDFGLISELEANGTVPDGIIFNDGSGNGAIPQTGDFEFVNGGVYDYLGLIDDEYSLNNIIRNGALGVQYTISDDLQAIYYDEDAVTVITDANGVSITVTGALYCKDMNKYGEPSVQRDATIVDYNKSIIGLQSNYDQSNWVKLVQSPNAASPVSEGTLQSYATNQVILPAHTLTGALVNNVNPEFHFTALSTQPNSAAYTPNKYITVNFNDTIVYTYIHNEFLPEGATTDTYTGTYGKYYDANTHSNKLEDNPTRMFYVAPKPQEYAIITYAVYSNPQYWDASPDNEPSDPGAFFVPAWSYNRNGHNSGGDYDNGYQQQGGFQVNWSLFEGGDGTGNNGSTWYQSVKPGESYQIIAIVRYTGDGSNAGLTNAGNASGKNVPRQATQNAVSFDFDTYASLSQSGYSNKFFPYDAGTSHFVIYPITLDITANNGVVTGIDENRMGEKTVAGVTYYNVTGAQSSEPFSGLNIVVTRYTDGSQSAVKVMK